MCDSFENVNFFEDLAVTTKRSNQIKTCTAVNETLQVLKSVVLNGWPESKRDCPNLFTNTGHFETKLQLKMVFYTKEICCHSYFNETQNA